MNAEYFVEFNQSILDIYWPTLTVRNFSNASAYIVFNYSFYVCGVKQTSRDLSRSETMTVSVGTSRWQLVEKYHLAIDSSILCNNRFLEADDGEFEWRIILIQPSS